MASEPAMRLAAMGCVHQGARFLARCGLHWVVVGSTLTGVSWWAHGAPAKLYADAKVPDVHVVERSFENMLNRVLRIFHFETLNRMLLS